MKRLPLEWLVELKGTHLVNREVVDGRAVFPVEFGDASIGVEGVAPVVAEYNFTSLVNRMSAFRPSNPSSRDLRKCISVLPARKALPWKSLNTEYSMFMTLRS